MSQPVLEPLWTAAQSRAADAYTIDEMGVSGLVLMEHAGRAVADHVKARHPGASHAVVFAGPGNNGGDGWVVARHLWSAGLPCPVVTLRDPSELTGDARAAASTFLKAAAARGWRSPALGGAFLVFGDGHDAERIVQASDADVIVDALFGTGLTRALEGHAAQIVHSLAQVPLPVVAVDLPSGLPTDGGAPLGPCVRATTTVTFAGRKIAHACEPGHALCGEVHVVDIGILAPHGAEAEVFRLLDASPLLPNTTPDAHKGHYGHVAVVMGQAGGAARLAATASLRVGAGLASILAEHPTMVPEPELMVRAANADALEGIDVLVIGPGLGHAHAGAARALLLDAAARGTPVVVDAEAIDVVAAEPIAGLCGVATPHPGEAGRALGKRNLDVQRDRIAAARALEAKLGGLVVVLKGSCPMVAGGGPLVVVEGGVPALAVAGSGDVLAGAIGGLLGRGLSPRDAAILGVAAHQRAGRSLPTRGHLAGELAKALAVAWERT